MGAGSSPLFPGTYKNKTVASGQLLHGMLKKIVLMRAEKEELPQRKVFLFCLFSLPQYKEIRSVPCLAIYSEPKVKLKFH